MIRSPKPTSYDVETDALSTVIEIEAEEPGVQFSRRIVPYVLARMAKIEIYPKLCCDEKGDRAQNED